MKTAEKTTTGASAKRKEAICAEQEEWRKRKQADGGQQAWDIVLEDYSQHLEEQRFTPESQKNMAIMAGALRRFAEARGVRRWPELTTPIAEAWVNSPLKNGFMPSEQGKANRWRIGRSFQKHMAINWDSTNQPFLERTWRMERPKKAPSRATVAAFLEPERNESGTEKQVRCLAEVLYATGMRVTEALKLEWLDIDMSNGTARINEGKGNKPRTVMFGRQAAALLREMQGGERWRHDKVFDGMERHRAAQAFEKRSERKGLPSITPHDLRRAFATHLVEAGASMEAVQELMGHNTRDMTARYVTPSREWLVKQYARLPQVSPASTQREGARLCA
jgi:integrase